MAKETKTAAQRDVDTPYKTRTPDHTPGDVTEDDQTADASVRDLEDAANSGPVDESVMTPEVQPEVVETIQAQGIGPRDPYPTGDPPNAEEGFTRIHGYKRDLEDTPNQGVQGVKGGKKGPNEGTQPLGKGPSGTRGTNRIHANASMLVKAPIIRSRHRSRILNHDPDHHHAAARGNGRSLAQHCRDRRRADADVDLWDRAATRRPAHRMRPCRPTPAATGCSAAAPRRRWVR